MNILKRILNIIFPAACRKCGGSVSSDAPTACFCKRCWDAIKWFDGPCCARCGVPYPLMSAVSLGNPSNYPSFPRKWESRLLPAFWIPASAGMTCLAPGHLCGACRKNPLSFDGAISAGPYEGVLAEAIKLFKYKKKVHVGRALAHSIIPLSPPLEKGNFVMPVPLHPSRLREREFNQSAILASVIGERLGIPVLTDILLRERHTKPQVELDMKERKKNVVGAFTVQNKELIIDKDIILVDDVYTTGSTVNECAKALKKNGAKKVCVVTIARMAG